MNAEREEVVMTEKMIAELREVVRMSERATQGEWHRAQLSNVILSERKSASGITSVCAYRPEDDVLCTQAVNFLRAHHSAIEAAVSRYQALRDADPYSGVPYIARECWDSWGNLKTEWLGGLDADRAIDAAIAQHSGREG